MFMPHATDLPSQPVGFRHCFNILLMLLMVLDALARARYPRMFFRSFRTQKAKQPMLRPEQHSAHGQTPAEPPFMMLLTCPECIFNMVFLLLL